MDSGYKQKKKFRISTERTVYTYAEIWRASYWTKDKAEKETEGSYFQIMASLVFTAFAFEAYLNHLGEKTFSCWDDLESLSPKKKLNVIAEKLKIELNYGERPFQTINELFEFRNDIAHGKTVILKSETIINDKVGNEDKYLHNFIEPNWEKYCTLENITRARRDIESVMRSLHNVSAIKDEPLFNTGYQAGSAQLIE